MVAQPKDAVDQFDAGLAGQRLGKVHHWPGIAGNHRSHHVSPLVRGHPLPPLVVQLPEGGSSIPNAADPPAVEGSPAYI